jgi:hypothetical protein
MVDATAVDSIATASVAAAAEAPVAYTATDALASIGADSLAPIASTAADTAGAEMGVDALGNAAKSSFDYLGNAPSYDTGMSGSGWNGLDGGAANMFDLNSMPSYSGADASGSALNSANTYCDTTQFPGDSSDDLPSSTMDASQDPIPRAPFNPSPSIDSSQAWSPVNTPGISASDIVKAGSGQSLSWMNSLMDFAKSAGGGSIVNGLINSATQGHLQNQKHQWDMDAIARARQNLSAPVIMAPYRSRGA